MTHWAQWAGQFFWRQLPAGNWACSIWCRLLVPLQIWYRKVRHTDQIAVYQYRGIHTTQPGWSP